VRFDLLIVGGHIVDPASNRDELADLAVAEGAIAAIDRCYHIAMRCAPSTLEKHM
jgi:predicted amidohydrolase